MTLRTVPLPDNPAALWINFQWPSKDPADDLDYEVDAKRWLDDAKKDRPSLSLASADATWSPGLNVTLAPVIPSDTSVRLRISGGTPDTTATVRVLLHLSSDEELAVVVTLRIRAAAPDGLVGAPANDNHLTIGGVTITVAGLPIAI